MKAYCIATHPQIYKEHTVYKIKDELYYTKTTSKSLPFLIFERTDKKIDEIAEGYKGSYYLIDDKLYSTFLTNEIGWLEKERITQLSLFD